MEVKKLISGISAKISSKNSCYFCLAITDDVFCTACEQDFIRDTQRCLKCGKANQSSDMCGNCRLSPPVFFSTTVLFNYEYPARKLVLAFKFKRRAELSILFADRLANTVKMLDKLPEALIPVPLHKKRQAQRGYNQSLELAKHLAIKLNVPLNTALCKRIVNTNPQSELPMESRKRNVKNAFALSGDNIPKHIAIIDDVITTGSTINEMSLLFKKAGCEHIDVWAIART